MSTEIVMPQMGESIAEGTITRWLKKVGERVEKDEPLFEISTDKVDAEIPSPAAGTLIEVRHQEGETVEVNKVVALIGEEGEASAAPAPEQQPAAAPPAQPPPTAPAATQAAAPEPPPPPPQQPQPAQPAQAPAQTQQPQQQAAAAASGASPSAQATPAPSATGGAASAGAQSRAAAPPSAGGGAAEPTVEELRRTRSSPLVRKIASEHNIDISRIEGTGTSGRVTKNDILSFIESGGGAEAATAAHGQQQQQQEQQPAPAMRGPATQTPAAPPPLAQGDRVEPMSVMRRRIAEHMVMSRRTSAHVTTVYEIDMTRIARLRERHKSAFQQAVGTKLTYMPFIFQAVTSAIRRFPVFNAQVSGEQIVYKRDINLGMAVALDWGLIVPVIKRADDLSLGGLAKAANDLADRARAKQLKPDEVAGGTFTITNPGVFGGLFGTPIINQPQVAILGVGAIEKRPKVITTDEGDDILAIRHMAFFALSFDHRIIDGADAERFLAYVKEILEAGEFQVV